MRVSGTQRDDFVLREISRLSSKTVLAAKCEAPVVRARIGNGC